ncbi:hypothetical protein B0T16DRAFT_449948 [Cercophora newfieldiana]|uniref:Uncharacterized protein n=1 Tax=Cercophora newfieldiana TaxID=92897 RepID=A0AA40CI45_9PEZI|nr:hypothetical protein B0T16DRAFT_449948 [Cercophora newfieldiana]
MNNENPQPERLLKIDLAPLWNKYLRQKSEIQWYSQGTGSGNMNNENPQPERLLNPLWIGDRVPQRPRCSTDLVGHSARDYRLSPQSHATSQSREDPESLRSNPSTFKREGSGSRSPSPPKRSKATSTLASHERRDEFGRGAIPVHGKGRLWSPSEDATPPRPASYDKSNVAVTNRIRGSSGTNPRRQPPDGAQQYSVKGPEDKSTELIKQPETRPISQEQLVAEVKGIYAGLVMMENKCVEVDTAQNSRADPANTKLNNEQWQALIALHRTFLHEHHEFFLASQHPNASLALRRLASKYAMPAPMWRHGIHSFLELLRHRLPAASPEHMLSLIYLAYSTSPSLYETVPAFKDTWIKCLGDLGHYMMAIENDNVRNCRALNDRRKGQHTENMGNPTRTTLSRLLRFFAPLFMISVSLALTAPLTRVPWHVPKVLMLATSAMGSFGTGMVSLNLDMSPPSGSAGPADMSLRVISSLLVAVLAVGYSFWFLGQAPHKTRQFNRGVSLAVVLWIIVRLLRASGNSDKAERSGSDYLWLDEINLLACASVVAGIVNAERSIFSPAGTEEGDDNSVDGRHNGRLDDIEDRGDNGRPNGCQAGNNASGSSTSFAESASAAVQAVAGG